MTNGKKMSIIAIEGLDKSGKNTATGILTEYFRAKGLKVERFGYPNYDTPIGELIHGWLKGTFHADTKTFELLQAADKQQGQSFIEQCEEDGVDVLIMDRYLHSLWAYGAYDNDELWLQELTKYMRLPDYVMYMNVEPEVSMHRRGKYGDNDLYESDVERLRHTKREYECLFKERGDVPVCVIDANVPPLMVKAQVFKYANELYSLLTGEKEATFIGMKTK